MWAGLYINFDKVRGVFYKIKCRLKLTECGLGVFYKIKCRLKLTECGLDYINELSIIDNKVTMFFPQR